ncbi:hypothetical protein [Bacillus sp. XF8]|uniref:hypothetical protein n=1 Tax=Bacillus sp. XF8 TaxID=2819289 RepID=UPI001AA09361|nr:hypothetical protein [Bacillus sp. XF8]MBO1582330.1 hypothetical protein [Bacillus sp. XF8]
MLKENLERFVDSVSDKPGWHYLNHFKFDKDGNIANDFLMNWDTKEQISESPRKGVSVSANGEIQVDLVVLEEAARKMRYSAEQFYNQVPRVIEEVMRCFSSTQSERIGRKIRELHQALDTTSRIYAARAYEISEFVQKKKDEYQRTDENYTGFGWLKK